MIAPSDAPTLPKQALYSVDINDVARLGEAITAGMSQLSPVGTRFQGVSIEPFKKCFVLLIWPLLFFTGANTFKIMQFRHVTAVETLQRALS